MRPDREDYVIRQLDQLPLEASDVERERRMVKALREIQDLELERADNEGEI